MEIFDVLPISLDPSDLAERLRFNPERAGFPSLDDLAGLARGLIVPRAIYEVAYIGAKGEGTVEVAGVTFHSPILRGNLERANKVFPYIITVGPELERAAARPGRPPQAVLPRGDGQHRPRTGGRLARRAARERASASARSPT